MGAAWMSISKHLIRAGLLREVRVERFLLEGTPRIVGSMYRGVAVK